MAGATPIRVGTAGWSIPRISAESVPGIGTHLERYGRVFRCTEINSSFHRPHAAETYARWAAATPDDFRFAVKLPRTITHDLQLRRSRAPLERFLDESGGLGPKRGPLLVQLPPSFAWSQRLVARFFELLRGRYDGPVACEPRHPTWFSAAAVRLLARFRVARVAADPAPAAGADVPGGWTGLIYFRLHGSPRTYWSSYDDGRLGALTVRLASARDVTGPIRDATPHATGNASARVAAASSDVTAPEVWCIFDNTASGAALGDALKVQRAIGAL